MFVFIYLWEIWKADGHICKQMDIQFQISGEDWSGMYRFGSHQTREVIGLTRSNIDRGVLSIELCSPKRCWSLNALCL